MLAYNILQIDLKPLQLRIEEHITKLLLCFEAELDFSCFLDVLGVVDQMLNRWFPLFVDVDDVITCGLAILYPFEMLYFRLIQSCA